MGNNSGKFRLNNYCIIWVKFMDFRFIIYLVFLSKTSKNCYGEISEISLEILFHVIRRKFRQK